jgi:hypothetical protein
MPFGALLFPEHLAQATHMGIPEKGYRKRTSKYDISLCKIPPVRP